MIVSDCGHYITFVGSVTGSAGERMLTPIEALRACCVKLPPTDERTRRFIAIVGSGICIPLIAVEEVELVLVVVSGDMSGFALDVGFQLACPFCV